MLLAPICLAILATPAIASAAVPAIASAAAPAIASAAAPNRRAVAQRPSIQQAGSLPRALAKRTRKSPVLAGYVWSGNPIGGYYTYNSAAGPVSVTSTSTGFYTVLLGGLGQLHAGTVDITPYGTPGLCSAGFWTPAGANWRSTLRCFSLGGVLQNSMFDIAVTQPKARPRGVLNFDYVPASASKRLTGQYQYNSAGQANSVRHLGTGRYRISMRGPAARGVTGTVKVTAVNASPGDCEVAGWHGTRAGQVIRVDCFSAAGAPKDRPFTITYVRHGNLLGQNGLASAYAYADRPAAAGYQPRTQYDSHRGAKVNIVRVGLARYRVVFDGAGGPVAANGGDVQVTTVGSSDHHCSVLYWAQAPSPFAYVDCVDNLGNQAQSRFTIQWVVG